MPTETAALAEAEPRAQWTRALGSLGREIHVAVRGLARRPAFTAIAILSLGFGIGASTTVFSVIEAIDLRSLPFRDADRLVWLAEVTPPNFEMCSRCDFLSSPPTVRDWAARSTTIEAVNAVATGDFAWAHDDVRETLPSAAVSPGFFRLLGVQPVAGRDFVAADTATGAGQVALLSYAFWQSRFGASRQILGQSIATARGGRVTIIGILPKDFQFGAEAAIWTPLRLAEGSATDRLLTVVGRLKAGRSLRAADAELKTLSSQLQLSDPRSYHDWSAAVVPLRRRLTMPLGGARFTLFVITLLVLLIAVLNVGGVFVSRTLARQQEFAIRRALGADGLTLKRQFFAESLCVSLGGGAFGILVATLGIGFAPLWFSTDAAGLAVRLDAHVLEFVLCISILIAVAIAVAAEARIRSIDVGSTLRTATPELGQSASRLSELAVGLQIALALTVLAGASLLSQDYLELRYADLGFAPEHLYQEYLSGAAGQSQDPAAFGAMAAAVRSRLEALPGVLSVTLEHRSAMHPAIVRPLGRTTPTRLLPAVKAVDPNYFSTFGTPLLAGRAFGPADNAGAPLVAIVNRSAADALWPGLNPLGRRIAVGDSSTGLESVTVIGVAEDAERGELAQRHWPMVYRPLQQSKLYHANASLYLRLRSDSRVLPTAEQVVRNVTGRPAAPFQSMTATLDNELTARRMSAVALELFAIFGLLLAAVGVYGSVAFVAARRTREVGIRLALGGQRWRVVYVIIERATQLCVAGVLAGVCGALVLEKFLQSTVLATTAATPLVLGGAAGVLIAAVFAGMLVPAIRATRVDITAALRDA